MASSTALTRRGYTYREREGPTSGSRQLVPSRYGQHAGAMQDTLVSSVTALDPSTNQVLKYEGYILVKKSSRNSRSESWQRVKIRRSPWSESVLIQKAQSNDQKSRARFERLSDVKKQLIDELQHCLEADEDHPHARWDLAYLFWEKSEKDRRRSNDPEAIRVILQGTNTHPGRSSLDHINWELDLFNLPVRRSRIEVPTGRGLFQNAVEFYPERQQSSYGGLLSQHSHYATSRPQAFRLQSSAQDVERRHVPPTSLPSPTDFNAALDSRRLSGSVRFQRGRDDLQDMQHDRSGYENTWTGRLDGIDQPRASFTRRATFDQVPRHEDSIHNLTAGIDRLRTNAEYEDDIVNPFDNTRPGHDRGQRGNLGRRQSARYPGEDSRHGLEHYTYSANDVHPSYGREADIYATDTRQYAGTSQVPRTMNNNGYSFGQAGYQPARSTFDEDEEWPDGDEQDDRRYDSNLLRGSHFSRRQSAPADQSGRGGYDTTGLPPTTYAR